MNDPAKLSGDLVVELWICTLCGSRFESNGERTHEIVAHGKAHPCTWMIYKDGILCSLASGVCAECEEDTDD